MTGMADPSPPVDATEPTARRVIRWEGFINARDLGGLPTRDGRRTRFGAFIRSADPRFVTPDSWRAAYDAGLRTIVDLRNPNEIHPGHPTTPHTGSSMAALENGPVIPPGMTRAEVAIDDADDVDFWHRLNTEKINGTPLYYRPFLAAKPHRLAAALRVLAATGPGTVLCHCAVGRDRTGLISLLLLSLADVEPTAIADDYTASAAALAPVFAALGLSDQNAYIDNTLARRGTTTRDALLDVLDGFDAYAYLSNAGLTPTQLDTLGNRLVA
jgi:hypothetical protein